MSLLPIIRVMEFLPGTLEGGTTRPMLVVGEDGRKYVLKIFSKKDAAQRSYTVAEVMANLLAKQFDLNFPEGVYMTIDKTLMNTLKTAQPNIYKQLEEKATEGILFGSLYYEGYPIYSPAQKDRLLELDEFERIFAFDMLICNDDRRPEKPNILRGPNHYLLIDHEKAFEGLRHNLDNMKKGILPYYYSNHLFYQRLQKAEKRKPNSVNFETFTEYFRNLTLREIEENVDFLIKNGYDKEECKAWLLYLVEQKAIYLNFVSLLKQKIK